jgi:hypothetical protein
MTPMSLADSKREIPAELWKNYETEHEEKGEQIMKANSPRATFRSATTEGGRII